MNKPKTKPPAVQSSQGDVLRSLAPSAGADGKKRRGSPPASPGTPGREPETPAPAAPNMGNPISPKQENFKAHPRAMKSSDKPKSGIPDLPLSEKSPNQPPAAKPKKSPHEKRAEKKAEREGWSQEAIDEAFRAAGGTPKSPGDPTPPPPSSPTKPGPGRPSKYPDLDLERIERHARGGMTKKEIAWAEGMCYETLRTYQRDFSAFSAAIARGRAQRVQDAEASLHRSANGQYVKEEKVFYDSQIGQVVKAETIKYIPADVRAQQLILLKAETGSYAPRQEVKHSGKFTHNHAGSIQNLTDEQLDARIARLVSEAGQGAAGPTP